MSRLTSLPDEVIKLIMQHVPPKHRLTSCCLVNRRLHAAAVAATQGLVLGQYFFNPTDDDVRVASPEGARSVLEWLDLYGHHLTSLKLQEFPQPLRQLPCTNLLHLQIDHGCSVQLRPSADGSPGVLHSVGCSHLTRLDLHWCTVLDATAGAAVVDSMSSLVNLQHLNWSPEEQCILSAATLPRLHHLTSLYLRHPSVENLQQLGGLTSLQDGCIMFEDDMALVLGPKRIPGLSFPTTITKLELLAPLEVGVMPLVPATLQHFDLFCSFVGNGADEGPGAFLSSMTRLQHLTRLCLFVDPHRLLGWLVAGPAYSALTASTNLIELSISCTDLPAGIWPFVFPTGHKLPHLTSLQIQDGELVRDPAPAVWGPAAVASLVSCCPNLCAVEKLYLQRGPHVSELQQLTGLTRMSVVIGSLYGDVAAAQQSVKGLAAVTQLQCLHLYLYNPGVSVAALLPLTSLTALTKLAFTGRDIDANGGEVPRNDVGLLLAQVSQISW